jgi:hypothetical protein
MTEVAARARAAADELSAAGTSVSYVRSTFVPADETWFLLYDAPSAEVVESALALAELPRARVHEALTDSPPTGGRER